jgi:hypothetical protein
VSLPPTLSRKTMLQPGHLAMMLGSPRNYARDAPPDDKLLQRAVIAHEAVVTEWRAIVDGHEAAVGNPAWSVQEAHRRSHEAAERRAATVDKRLDAARAGVQAEIDHLQARVGELPEAPPEAPEIRAFVRALAAAERTSFVDRAIKAGDAATIAAVLTGVAYLSGLTPEQAAMWREEWQHRQHPAAFRRLDQLRRADLELAKAGRGLRELIAWLIPTHQAGGPEAAAAAARATAAAERALRS